MTKKRGRAKKHDQRDVRAMPAGQALAYADLQRKLRSGQPAARGVRED